jgi:pimeloyl-ACP methyl ester carboxylesterase
MRALRVLPENCKNSDAVHIVAVLTGFAWLARGLLALTKPTYYAPVTAADYLAVALTTVAFALLAPSLWFLAASSGRYSRIAGAVGGVASLIAAVGNFVEDALHIPAFGTVYVVGASGVVLALIGMAVLLMRAGCRWHAAVAIFSPQRTVARARALIAEVQAEIVPGVGHLMSEERPDLVNRRVREFMLTGGAA